MSTENIIVKGAIEKAIVETIRHTVGIFKEALEKGNPTCDASLYVKDVEFLLSLLGDV